MTDPHPNSTKDPILEQRLRLLFDATQIFSTTDEKGTAIRLHGGVQICLYRHTENTATGTWVFPLPFRGAPKVVGSAKVTFGEPTEARVGFTKGAGTDDVDFVAIGIWRQDGLA